MSTHEIPREEWLAFFDSFSRQHQGWLVTIEVLGSDLGAQLEAHALPFEGITADLKEKGKDTVAIILGDKPGDHLTHSVTEASRVTVEKTEEGAHEALQIESAAGTRTLLRFRSAMLPEMVDGIVP